MWFSIRAANGNDPNGKFGTYFARRHTATYPGVRSRAAKLGRAVIRLRSRTSGRSWGRLLRWRKGRVLRLLRRRCQPAPAGRFHRGAQPFSSNSSPDFYWVLASVCGTDAHPAALARPFPPGGHVISFGSRGAPVLLGGRQVPSAILRVLTHEVSNIPGETTQRSELFCSPHAISCRGDHAEWYWINSMSNQDPTQPQCSADRTKRKVPAP